jgi:transposase
LSDEQQAELVAWVSDILPRNTHEVAALIELRFGVSFARRSGLTAQLHSFGFVYREQ